MLGFAQSRPVAGAFCGGLGSGQNRARLRLGVLSGFLLGPTPLPASLWTGLLALLTAAWAFATKAGGRTPSGSLL